jgi:hypothetical protein
MRIKESFFDIIYNSVGPKYSELKPERCLVRAFFEKEEQKPKHLRQTSCMISCPCSQCNPGIL